MTRDRAGLGLGAGHLGLPVCFLEWGALTQESGLYYIDNKKPLSSFENDLLGAMPQ